MAVRISDDCISCDACAQECPNTAIYPGGESYTMADGTKHGDSSEQDPLADDHYFVVFNKCTQCVGFNAAPACMAVCPVEAISLDPEHEETQDDLLAKKVKLHGA